MAKISDIAIDLGTSQVRIYMKGKGIVYNQPNILALNRDTREIIAIGDKARAMVGRTPSKILTIRPLRDGTIADYELASYLLRSFVLQALEKKKMFTRPRAILCVPTAVNEMEKRSLISTMFDAGMRRTQLMNRSIAAAIGAGLPIEEGTGTMLVDISAGVTDIAVLSYGKVVLADTIPVGGDRMDEAIIRHFRRKYNLLIGEHTAEEIKKQCGSAIFTDKPSPMEIYGRNLISGLPKAMTINGTDATEALAEPLQDLIEGIHSTLEHTPAELASDIFDYGIFLSGGGANLANLGEAISKALNVQCIVSENPECDVVMGCGRALENMHDLGRFLQ